jgi:uncharacterized cupredoxin-like copper-binding protein
MNKKYILLGIILLILGFLSANVFSSSLDNVEVKFEKDFYSMIYDDTLKINYTLENNSSENKELLLYTVCDQDVLTCTFSKTFSLLNNSSIQSSFQVKSIDDGISNIKFFIKDMQTNEIKEFLLKVEVDDDLEDGKFEIDVYKLSVCKGVVENNFIFDRVYLNDFYNISLSSNTLNINLKGSNNRYIQEDDVVLFDVDSRNTSVGNHTVTFIISNENVYSKKTFSIYVSQCAPIVHPDFTVTGPSSINHDLVKEKDYTLEFNIKNRSLKNKQIFISPENDSDLIISFSNREINLSPGSSKKVLVTFKALKDLPSGDYPVEINFFDEKTTITRNFVFKVQPIEDLNIRLLQNSINLEIGKIYSIGVVIENKGDLLETIYFDKVLSNDLKINNMTEKVSVAPYTTATVFLDLSAGENTIETTSQIKIITNNKNDFYKEFILNVNAFRKIEPFKINFLSFPKEISVDINKSKEFVFEVYNFGDEKIIISNIEFIGLVEDLDIEILKNIEIFPKSSKTISGNIVVGDVPVQEIDLDVFFYNDKGQVISKKLTLKITDVLVEYQEDAEKSILTGFFNLSSSILLGIIFIALLLIVLFLTGVIKTKHRSYVKN